MDSRSLPWWPVEVVAPSRVGPVLCVAVLASNSLNKMTRDMAHILRERR